jgi:hypothetical protein
MDRETARVLLDIAQRKWIEAKPRQRVVKFSLGGQDYRSTCSLFRIFVDTADGRRVASRFW